MGNRYISDGSDIKAISLCGRCRHKRMGKATCAAFPGGIPTVFLSGKEEHWMPYAGDHGIQFEPLSATKKD